MDLNAENTGYLCVMDKKFRKSTCAVCENRGSKLFRIPLNENLHQKWFTILKWNVPPERVQYILNNARVCDRHFSDSCFNSTLRTRLLRFACPDILEGIPSTSADIIPSTTSEFTSVVHDTNPPESLPSSPTTSFHENRRHLEVTPKTKKIKTLRTSVSKLKKKLYEKEFSSCLLGQLQKQLGCKPHLYNFIKSQLKMISKNSKGRRWSAKEKTFALEIYLHSPSAYKVLQEYFAFPSKATLHRYTYNIAKSPGFCKNLANCLKSQTSRMSETDRLCVLMIDEMAIKQGLTYAADLDRVDGYTTVQNDFKQKPAFATQALVFMARGIVKNWKQVLGYHFTSSSEKFSLQNLIHDAIDILHSCGLEVVSIVCDQGPANQKLFTEMKVTKNAPFFLYKGKKIYAMFDPPHLLKSVRNNLKNHGIYFKDKLVGNAPHTCFANWKHIEKLYEMDSENRLSACRNLTKNHIEVSGLKKMNVKLAAQVLSHSVAAALNLYVIAKVIDAKAIETAEFVYKMDKLFDSVNSRSLKDQRKERCGVSMDSCHVELWKEMISWIETRCLISKTTGRKIVPPCKNGWLITLNALIKISEDLLHKTKFILTSRFNQDPLENTFSAIRRRGGFRDNPDAYEFRHTIPKVIIINFLKKSSTKNCQDDDASCLIDFTKFDKKNIV